MSKIEINVQKISALTAQFTSLANSTDVVKQTVRGLKASVPQKVQARRNISARISQIANELRETEADIRKLSNFTQFATEEYIQAEKKVQSSVERATKNGLIPRAPSKGKRDGILGFLDFQQYTDNVKNFFGDPKNRAEWIRDGLNIYEKLTFLPGLISGGLSTAMNLSWMHLIRKSGYELMADGKGIKFRNLNLSPRMQGMLDFFNRNIGKIEGTKLSKFLKFQMLGLTSGIKHSGKTFANVIPKALSGVFVDEIEDFYKAIDKYNADIEGFSFKKALKNNVGDLIKGSKGLLKSNALTGLAIEGTSAVYKGYFQWKANEIEFANDKAKLHYENSKLVRTSAIDVTGTVVGGTVGTVIGATFGSSLGPLGTIAGGAVGGMIGSFVGGKAAEGVNNVIDFVSSKLWDPHRDKNSDSCVVQVKEKSKSLLESAKNFFVKPIFG